jgi:tape measure domain-containing protein
MADLGELTAQLSADVGQLRDDLSQAERLLNDYQRKTQSTLQRVGSIWGRTFRGVKSILGGVMRSVFSLQSAVAGLGAALALRSVVETSRKFEQFNNQLQFATGSAKAGAEAMQFIRDEADRLGLDLTALADTYSDFAAVTKDTRLEGEDTRKIFVGLAEAATVMGLTAEDTRGAMVALEQMVSKGRVSAEELRGQLGERLPGAFQLAAESMDMTTQELNKALENGDVMARDMLPRLARHLHETFSGDVERAAGDLTSQMARFRAALTDLQLQFARGGFIEAFTATLERLVTVMRMDEVRQSMRDLGAAFDARTIISGLQGIIRGAQMVVGAIEDIQITWLAVERAGLGVKRFFMSMGTFLNSWFREQINSMIDRANYLVDLIDKVAFVGPDARWEKIDPVDKDAKKELADLDIRISAISRSIADLQENSGVGDAAYTALEKIKQQLGEVDSRVRDVTESTVQWGQTVEQFAMAEKIRAIKREMSGLIIAGQGATGAADQATGDAAESTMRQADAMGRALDMIEGQFQDVRDEEARQIAGLQEIEQAGESMGETLENAITGWASNFSSQLNDLVWEADASFSQILKSFSKMITQMLIQKQVVEPILSNISFTGGGGTNAGQAHTGGIVGSLDQQRTVPAGTFADAPRYHTGGVVGDEKPVVAKEGEGIFTPEQMAALAPARKGGGPTEVHVHGVDNADEVDVQRSGPDGERMDIYLSKKMAEQAADPGSPFMKQMQANTNVRPTPADK